MTKAQKKVLDVIRHLSLEMGGVSPSYQEIADACGYSSLATIHKHILALEREGRISRSRRMARSVGFDTPRGGMCFLSGLMRDTRCPSCHDLVMADTTHQCGFPKPVQFSDRRAA